MSNKLNKKNNIKEKAMLPIIAGIVVVLAIAVFIGTHIADAKKQSASAIDREDSRTTSEVLKDESDIATQQTGNNSIDAEIEDGYLKLDASKLSEKVAFVSYESDGINMEIMVAKTSDDVIRCALNTCQVCNGSPYAYFIQSGNFVVCQNCMNQFRLTDIGNEQGGCNPTPVDFEEQDGYVLIATSDLDADAFKFIGWKQGI